METTLNWTVTKPIIIIVIIIIIAWKHSTKPTYPYTIHTLYILYKCRKTVSKCKGNHRKNDTNTNDKPTNTRQTDRQKAKKKKEKKWHTTELCVSTKLMSLFVYVCGYICVEWQNVLLIRHFAFALLLKLNTAPHPFSEHIDQKKKEEKKLVHYKKNWKQAMPN